MWHPHRRSSPLHSVMISNIQWGLYCHANAKIILFNLKVHWYFINPSEVGGVTSARWALSASAQKSTSSEAIRESLYCSHTLFLQFFQRGLGWCHEKSMLMGLITGLDTSNDSSCRRWLQCPISCKVLVVQRGIFVSQLWLRAFFLLLVHECFPQEHNRSQACRENDF